MAFQIKTSTPEEIARIKALEKIKLPTIEFDTYKYVFKGNDLILGNIILHHPTVEEIIEFGEEKYLRLVSLITMRAYDERVALDEAKLNYQEVSDFDIFIRNIYSIPIEMSSIVFGDLPLNQFKLKINEEFKEAVLTLNYNSIDYTIDKTVYTYIVTFFRRINFVSNKIKYDMADEMGRKFLIERTKVKAEFTKKANNKKKKDIHFESILLNISSFVVAKGIYSDKEIQKVKIGTLYEIFHRLVCIDDKNDFSAMMRTGFMKKEDISKGNYKLDYTRPLYE